MNVLNGTDRDTLLEFSALLQMEIEEKTEPLEIVQRLSEHLMPAVESMDLIKKAEVLGASKLRTERVIYSSVITAVYDRILEKKLERVREIFPYIEGRVRDKDKRIRTNALSFVFRNIQVIKGENIKTKGLAKTLIDLLKNRKKTVRVFYLKLISSNINEFAELLGPSDIKYLVNTIALVCECYLSQKESKGAHNFIKKLFAIINRLKYLGKLHLLNLFPLFEICDFSSSSLSPILKGLYKRCEKEVRSMKEYLKLVEEHKDEKDYKYVYSNLLLLLKCGVNEREDLFENYKKLVHFIETHKTQLYLFRILKESRHNRESALYLSEVQDTLENPEKYTNAETVRISLELYILYVKEGLVSFDLFKKTVITVFRKCKIAKTPILLFLNETLKEISPTPSDTQSLSLNPSILPTAHTPFSVESTEKSHVSIRETNQHFTHENQNMNESVLLYETPEEDKNTVSSVASISALISTINKMLSDILFNLIENKEAAELETFLNYFNPFEYGHPQSIYSIRNTITFYSVLWYMHTLQESPQRLENYVPERIVMYEITHADFDISLEFYFVLFILSETPRHFMTGLRDEVFAYISQYLEECLNKIRKSREYLRSNFSEIECSLTALVDLLDKKNVSLRTGQNIIERNVQTITVLLLYLLNSSKTFKHLCAISACMDLSPLDPADIERAKVYGIITQKNTKKFDKFISLAKKRPSTLPAEIDLSSVTEHSISTNLDTNIIEGVSKIDENKEE